jgi:hypothetical protein
MATTGVNSIHSAIAMLILSSAALSVQAQQTGATPVIWTNQVNVRADGNALAEGCNGCGNSGAVSQQTLTSGDGYVEFVAGTDHDEFSVGIGSGTPSTDLANIEFALRFFGNGNVEVRESGKYVADTRYTALQRFRVAIEAGDINYYKYEGSDLTLIHRSRRPAALQYPMRVEAAMLGPLTQVNEAVVAVAPASGGQSITWTNFTNAVANGNTLTGGSDNQNAGAQSVESLTGDGYVEFTAVETDKMRAVGLDNYNGSNTYQDIDFAIVLRQAAAGRSAVAEVWEGGKYISDTPYSAGTRFRIAVENGVVKYYKQDPNGTPAPIPATDARVANYPLYVDAALYDPQSTIAYVTGRRLN